MTTAHPALDPHILDEEPPSTREKFEGAYRHFLVIYHRLRSLLVNLPAWDPEPLSLSNLMGMSWVAQAVFVTTKLGVPDYLRAGPKTVTELAALAESDEGRLHQLMRALAGFGLFHLDSAGRYRLTLMSEALADPNSGLRLYVLLWGEQLWSASGQILSMLQSGRVAFELAWGKRMWEYYAANPGAATLFADYMNSVTDEESGLIAKAFDFGAYEHVVDIGGGRASLITAILQTYPKLLGTILDLPHMSKSALLRIHEANLADRCTFIGGSFLETVPAGADLYVIKHVLHDWHDEGAASILRNASSAMRPDSRLVIVEGLLDDRDNVGRFLKMRDLEQMFCCGGKVRTLSEFEKLLDNAGLCIEEKRRTPIWDGCLITARKA